MTTLNCADPSQQVARRDEAITALQSLALLNKLMVSMAGASPTTSTIPTGYNVRGD